MSDRIDDWRVFVAVATKSSFVAAARDLARSPQAITRAVAALEARLHVRLLHRTTRSVSLTSDGARLLERGRRVLDDVDALESRAADAPLAGTLTVTAPVWFGQLHVLPLLTDLLAQSPGVTARTLFVDRVVSLADEGVDVAVRIGALPDSALLARPLGTVRAVVVASPAYLRRAGTPRTPDDLADHDCIAFTGTTPIADRWTFPSASARRERSVRVRVRLVVDNAQAAVDAALAGAGVVRVLSYQVATLVAHDRLRVILDDASPPPLPVHLVRLPGPPSRVAEAFLAIAAAQLPARLARVALPSRRRRRAS